MSTSTNLGEKNVRGNNIFRELQERLNYKNFVAPDGASLRKKQLRCFLLESHAMHGFYFKVLKLNKKLSFFLIYYYSFTTTEF